MAEGFALPLQLLASVIIMNGAVALRGDAGAVVIIIIVVVLGNHIIRLRPISVEAGLAHCLVLHSLQSKKILLKPVGQRVRSRSEIYLDI
jgi:hypothetical protein